MSDLITLETVDQDGAIREAAEDAGLETRGDFFRKAALTGGTAALGGGLLLGGFPSIALGAAKPSKKGDVKILNFALTLEYLESEFYKEALVKAGLTGDLLAATKIVSRHEDAHVRFLKSGLGKARIKKPKFNFLDTTDNPQKYLATAIVLEDTGVSAYLGQAGNLKSKKFLGAAASILTVEARHASRFRAFAGKNFAPNTFDKGATAAKVRSKAGAFIV